MSDVWRVDRGGCRLCHGKGWFRNVLSVRSHEVWECSCRRSTAGVFKIRCVLECGDEVELRRTRVRYGWARLRAWKLARKLAGRRGPAWLAGADRGWRRVEVVYLEAERTARGLVLPLHGEVLVSYPVAGQRLAAEQREGVAA